MIKKLVQVYYPVRVRKGRNRWEDTHSILVAADSLEEAITKFKKDFPKVTPTKCQSSELEVVL